MIKRLVAVLSVCVALVLVAPSQALAAPNGLSDSELSSVRAALKDNGVPTKYWSSLVETISEGGLVDADDPDSDPVRTLKTPGSDGFVLTRIYEDGSRSRTIATDSSVLGQKNGDDSAISTQAKGSVKSCGKKKKSGWTYYSNCKVAYSGISFAYSFKANFKTKKKANAQITRAFSPKVSRAVGHDVSGPSVKRVHAKQSGKRQAQARMSFKITAVKVLWSRTVTLDLYVLNTKYSASTNL